MAARKRHLVSLSGIRSHDGDRKCTGRRCRENQEAAGKGIERRDIAGSGKVRHIAEKVNRCREEAKEVVAIRYTP
jgi:hypothetical protein